MIGRDERLHGNNFGQVGSEDFSASFRDCVLLIRHLAGWVLVRTGNNWDRRNGPESNFFQFLTSPSMVVGINDVRFVEQMEDHVCYQKHPLIVDVVFLVGHRCSSLLNRCSGCSYAEPSHSHVLAYRASGASGTFASAYLLALFMRWLDSGQSDLVGSVFHIGVPFFLTR